MKPLFNTVKVRKPKTNLIDLSFESKLSFNMGELIPVVCQEVVPGDRFKISTEMMLRLAPMLAPLYHRVNVYIHWFKIPMRLLWNNWATYITGGVDGLQTATFPTLTLDNANKAKFALGTLADYLGIPDPGAVTITNAPAVNALIFRAYQLVYNEFYRDQTQNTAAAITLNDTITTGSAEYDATLLLRNRCWEKDYFTSALPWTQRGANVVIPGTPQYATQSVLKTTSGAAPTTGTLTANAGSYGMLDAGSHYLRVENLTSYDILVNDFRRSTRLQQWLEANALSGSRLVEIIERHFGVKDLDARLQRPEYIGGGKIPIVISEVVSAVKEATNPQGTLTGHGMGAGVDNGCVTFCHEHGYIMGIMSVMPRTAYQQGIPRKFTKADKFDFFWPEFETIGEQPIKQKEIYCAWSGTNTQENTFGYAPRYAEYKFNNSECHGDFRSTLNYWTMTRIFASEPGLNSAFMTADPTMRIFAVNDSSDHLWAQLYFNIRARRPMSVYGTPSI